MVSFFLLAGCGSDNAPSTIAGESPVNDNSAIDPPEFILLANTVYKPFAREHAGKFSLGDFDSPHLIQLDDYTNFAASSSSIFLNDVQHKATKTNYQGNTYIGLREFGFDDYFELISDNRLTIKVNLVATNGTIITNGGIVNGLLVSASTKIHTWQDLQGMKHDMSGQYELMNDINFPPRGRDGLAIEGFEPIGVGIENSFKGSFAGNGHTISNFSIKRTNQGEVALWGDLNEHDSVIKDFVLDHAGIAGNRYVAGVIGFLHDGIITNVGVISSQNKSISVSGTGDSSRVVGGLVGWNSGKVHGYFEGTISGNSIVGGLVGGNTREVVGYAMGEVSGADIIGGLVGQNEGGVVVGYFGGVVSGVNRAGGLAGKSFRLDNSQITPIGYWDTRNNAQGDSVGQGDGSESDPNVTGISSISNVDFSNGVYTDTGDSNKQVFTNATFLKYFSLPGESDKWPILKGIE